MFELPETGSMATAAVAVGALFMLRYVFVMRRLWRATGHRPGFQFADYFSAARSGAFGQEREPERRYALRQLVLGFVFLAVGLCLFAWLLVVGSPITPPTDGNLTAGIWPVADRHAAGLEIARTFTL